MEIKVARNILDANKDMARRNRALFSEKGIFVMNVMSSPGAGKTTLLEKTLSYLMPEISSAVIVGDISTTNDADRLKRSGAPVIQINTDVYGGNCHLTADFIGKTAMDLDLDDLNLLIVENVGNLVCPAEFDIGEDARVVVISVTEGEDKPLKYPVMFRKCDAAILNKIDLMPHLECEKDAFFENIQQIHPEMPVFELSATKDVGFAPWLDWLKAKVRKK